MGPPHDPYKAPERYAAMYDAAELTMRANWTDARGVPGRDAIAAYYAMITAVDDQIGRLLQSLDDLGLSDDTIVWVSSDHGDMLGSQGLRLKRKPWEESIRVPGIVRYPRQTRGGRTSDVFLSHVDFAPTWLGLCGVNAPAGMQGADLSRVVRGQSDQGPESAFFEIFGPFQAGGVTAGWRGVRTARYMYARYEHEPWVLYDLQADPFELTNLVREPSAAAVRDDMDRRLTAWMQTTGDSWSINWTHPVEDNGRLYKHETFYTVQDYLAWAKRHPELDAGR